MGPLGQGVMEFDLEVITTVDFVFKCMLDSFKNNLTKIAGYF